MDCSSSSDEARPAAAEGDRSAVLLLCCSPSIKQQQEGPLLRWCTTYPYGLRALADPARKVTPALAWPWTLRIPPQVKQRQSNTNTNNLDLLAPPLEHSRLDRPTSTQHSEEECHASPPRHE
jgi:hypothetical protein